MDAINRIADAADGLVYSSEADYTLEPFVWTRSEPFSPDALYMLTALPASTTVTKVDLNRFFAPVLHLDDGASDKAKARVAGFQKLLRLLRRNLRGVAVYKLGEVEMPAFVVGTLPDGTMGGLYTLVVET